MADTQSKKIQLWADGGERSVPENFGIDRADGWDVAYEQIGGSRPQRLVFNQLFREITGFIRNIFAEGVPRWDRELDYIHPAFVVGSNGTLYRSTADNGPATGNANDPVSEGTTWEVYG